MANRQHAEQMIDSDAPATRNEKVAQLAYEKWQRRGAPVGTPEEDWFRAEEELSDDDGGLMPAA